jgi:hypothetical protein
LLPEKIGILKGIIYIINNSENSKTAIINEAMGLGTEEQKAVIDKSVTE